jgi:hypothetical protein
MQSISLDETMLVFDKWKTDRAKVLCTGHCWGWEVILHGYIIEVSTERIIIQTAEKNGTLGIQLALNDLNFFYAEPREMPAENLENVSDADRMRSVIGVALPLRVVPALINTYTLDNPPPREKLFFCELPPE